MTELLVPASAAGERLDRFLAGALPSPDWSRARVQTLVRDGGVRVNGRPATKPAETLRAGDRVAVDEAAAAPSAAEFSATAPAPEAIALDVLHEDADLLVVNKFAGLVTHPGAGNWAGTLVNALLHHLGGNRDALSSAGGAERPGIVHRLDKDTSGCLVVAKNDFTHRALSAQFAGRTTDKRYLALVWGVPRAASGLIDAPIGRHPVQRKKMAIVQPPRGRVAQTEWRVRERSVAEVRRDGSMEGGKERTEKTRSDGVLPLHPSTSPPLRPSTLLECRLLTGRTHQIRVHLAHLGYPILGDALYASAPAARAAAPRQMLHAWRLGFRHPRSGAALEFRAPLPADFLAFGLDPREFEK